MGHRWWRYSRVAPALILATGGLLPTWGAGALSTGRARCSGHHIHPGLSVSTRVGPTVQWNLPALIWTHPLEVTTYPFFAVGQLTDGALEAGAARPRGAPQRTPTPR